MGPLHMRIAGKKYAVDKTPAIVLLVLIGAMIAIVFLAPPENAAAALSATSILGLVVQASLRSAFRVEACAHEEEKDDAGMDQK